jgi:hypothetical protein
MPPRHGRVVDRDVRETLGLGQRGKLAGETGERDDIRGGLGSTLLDWFGRVGHGVVGDSDGRDNNTEDVEGEG